MSLSHKCHPPKTPPKMVYTYFSESNYILLYVSQEDGRVYTPCMECRGKICLRRPLSELGKKSKL